ncbi:MAG TPA: septal ring lytic transglycosylase RlpA family protein [Rhizomicrobium sp.]|jgi:rare lipoprotein A
MNRVSRLILLSATISLASCTTQTPPPSAPPMTPPAEAPQASEGQPFFTQAGIASFYGAAHDGNLTASGETFDQHDFTAAHRTLAFGTVVRVINTENGRSVKVSINDRGPHIRDRIIDLSYAAARALGVGKNGLLHVRLEAFHGDQAS